MTDFRVGHGYDVHRLKAGRALVIGGVKINHEMGLDGHSDADVLIHAIMDALLGAVGLGDIGRHFPDTDTKFLGISSMLLLERVAGLVSDEGYKVSNIDATVVMQRPKLATHIPKMQEKIAKTLGISVSRVNIKATTEERLGFTGSEEGAAAHAVTLVYRD
jgi:2-C-methyl-D-erythritol 2,4-cyclodiphosphate synthase